MTTALLKLMTPTVSFFCVPLTVFTDSNSILFGVVPEPIAALIVQSSELSALVATFTSVES